MTTSSYQVTGMTCGHCVNAVSSELQGLDGVQDVTVDLNAHGASTVTVTSAAPVQREQVVAALDEAGDYHLLDV
jgi:copper chaperone